MLVVCATSSRAQDSSVIKPCEQAIDELKVRRVEVDGLKEQIRLLQERDKLRDEFEANQAEQIAFWKSAATDRKDALGIDDRVDAIRREQLTDFRDEVTRLRTENEKLRRGKAKWLVGGVILGSIMPKLP